MLRISYLKSNEVPVKKLALHKDKVFLSQLKSMVIADHNNTLNKQKNRALRK